MIRSAVLRVSGMDGKMTMQTNSKIKSNKSCSCHACNRGRNKYFKRLASKKIRRTGLERFPRVRLDYTD